MPYSDNSASDIVLDAKPAAGPTARIDLLPYNRLIIVVTPVNCTQGTLTFEGSVDTTNWYELALKSTETAQIVRTVSLGGFTGTRAYAMALEDSATAYFRVTLTANVQGDRLTIKARKENS